MQCSQKIGEEALYPKVFYVVHPFRALRYTQPCIVFRCFLAPWEDSIAHTRFLLAFHHGKAKEIDNITLSGFLVV